MVTLEMYQKEIQPLIKQTIVWFVGLGYDSVSIGIKVQTELGTETYNKFKEFIVIDIEAWMDVAAQGLYAYDSNPDSLENPWKPTWEEEQIEEDKSNWNSLEDIYGELAQ